MSIESQDNLVGRLLVVDDNEMNRDMLSRRLTRRGHDVLTAADGQEALAMVERESFDVILLDVMMPGITGLDVLRQIRRTHDGTSLPVVMVTAKDASSDVVEALEAGANDYVTKPLDFPVVSARVRTQITLKRSVDQILHLEENLKRHNAELERINQRMRTDLEAAARVQQSGLPSSLPAVEGFGFAWAYEPCEQLGGDSLNIFRLDDKHIGLYVLDVSGHGVPAALLSVTLNRELRPRRDGSSLVTEVTEAPPGYAITKPGDLVAKLNRNYPMVNASGRFFTAIYGLLDVETRRLHFVGAGHPPLVHVNGPDKRLNECDSSGYPVGLVEDAAYEESTIELQPGDRVYLYSDGLIEQPNVDGKMFGRSQLIDAMLATHHQPLGESVDSLVGHVRHWANGDDIRDDLSILALEVREESAGFSI